MAQVDVSVNGQSYRIACEDGQEDRLVDLAAMVDEKVREREQQHAERQKEKAYQLKK